MDAALKSRMLIRDVRGNTVATDLSSVARDAISFAYASLGLALEKIAIGDNDGDAVYGFIPSLHSDRLPTPEEQAAIGGFVECSDDNAEYRAHIRLEQKIDEILAHLEQNPATATETPPATPGSDKETPPKRGRGIDALIPPVRKKSPSKVGRNADA